MNTKINYSNIYIYVVELVLIKTIIYNLKNAIYLKYKINIFNLVICILHCYDFHFIEKYEIYVYFMKNEIYFKESENRSSNNLIFRRNN